MMLVAAFAMLIVFTKCHSNVLEFLYSLRRNMPSEPNYNETFFSSLQNYDVNASRVTEEKYPWVARVVHSRSLAHPYVCTAVCVEDRVFITAARCLYSLKVSYTTAIYQKHRFSVIAFVLPSNLSKQAFDDIGFIVVNEGEFQGQWAIAQLFHGTNRTDENFNWFADLNLPEDTSRHVVVGYTTPKDYRNIYLHDDEQYKLTELNVAVNINICPEILIYNKLIRGFHVPCYYSCSVEQFKSNERICSNYHGVLGGTVLDTNTGTVLGIATWGATFSKYELPVGFCVPNSKTFYKDFICARRIKLDTGSLVIDGYYQALCEDIN